MRSLIERTGVLMGRICSSERYRLPTKRIEEEVPDDLTSVAAVQNSYVLLQLHVAVEWRSITN